LFWRESWAERHRRPEALFEDVRIEFASAPDRHIVRLNGTELAGFARSDTKFARLLLLAAARWADPDVELGGWLKKSPALQLDEKENDLRELRNALALDPPNGCGGLRP